MTRTKISSRLVDVHHHAIPPRYLAALSARGIDGPVKGASFPSWNLDASLAAMEAAGSAFAFLSVSAPGLGWTTGANARAVARDVNEYLAGLVRANPASFGAFALVPMDHVDAALSEVAYGLDVLQLDGIGLFTSAFGVYLGDPSFEPLMEELAARKVPVFVHPSVPVPEPVSFGLPASVIEFPIETTRAAANLLFSGTLDRHPELTFILSHAGGAVPYLARRMTHATTINPALTGRPPKNLIGALRRLYYDVAMSATPEQLACLHSLVGGDRILFGSDFPFMPLEHGVHNATGLLGFSGMTRAELEKAGWENARKLFPRLAAGASGAP